MKDFRVSYLEKGLVEKIVVTNKTLANVYAKVKEVFRIFDI